MEELITDDSDSQSYSVQSAQEAVEKLGLNQNRFILAVAKSNDKLTTPSMRQLIEGLSAVREDTDFNNFVRNNSV